MKHRNKRLDKNLRGVSAFQTFPLAEAKERDDKTNVGIPSIEGVKSAKDWVDFNKK